MKSSRSGWTGALGAGRSRRKAEAAGPMQGSTPRRRDAALAKERTLARLAERESRFRSLAREVWKMQEEEQRRLARGLHDGLGQTLTALTHQLERLRRKVDATSSAELASGLADSVAMVRMALDEGRELSRLLRPPVLDDLGLAAALSWLARTLETRTGLKVDLAADGLDERLHPDIETLVFRLVQEALNNVLRHAGVDRAEVAVQLFGDRLELQVSDAGRGFDPRAGEDDEVAGSGLRGLRDRLELFGGSLELVSAPGKGTRLCAEILLAEVH